MKSRMLWLMQMMLLLSCSRSVDDTDRGDETGGIAPTVDIPSANLVIPPKVVDIPSPSVTPLDDEQRRTFNKNIMKFQRRWYDAPNDIKRTAIYDELKDYEKSFFEQTTTVENWRGSLFHMGKQDYGDDICLMVDLGEYLDSVGVSQGCQGSILSPDQNGIKKGTAVYEQLGNFSDLDDAGACVQFSGKINSSINDENDEMAAMHRPSYTMQFTSVEKCPKKKKAKKQ